VWILGLLLDISTSQGARKLLSERSTHASVFNQAPTHAQTIPELLRKLLAQISSGRMIATVEQLCSDRFRGRGSVSNNSPVAEWIVSELRRHRIFPRLQHFEMTTSKFELNALPELAAIDRNGVTRSFEHRVEFSEHSRSAPLTESKVGSATSWREGLHQDEWIIMERGVGEEELATFCEKAAMSGALGILVPAEVRSDGFMPKQFLRMPQYRLPVLQVRPDVLTTLKSGHIRASVPIKSGTAEGINVEAEIAGTRLSLAESPLILGAHYDALGDDPSGHRFPGAGDNAAGVAVLLELARILGSTDTKPHRPIRFVGFDAEELGALGSKAYADTLPKGSEPLVVNLDGAAAFNESVYVEATQSAGLIIDALDAAGRLLEVPMTFGNVASDNRRFASLGFKSVGIALGARTIHSPADTVDSVDPQAMVIAAQLLLGTVWGLAYQD
jgi:aminopeptidase YwaD